MLTPSLLPRLLALLLLAALFGGAALAPARGQDKKDEEEKKIDPKEIARLIDLLADEDDDKRKSAEQKLIEYGEQSHEAVRKAAKDHPDADVRLRATLLEKAIARGAFRELRKMTGHEKWVRSIAVTKDGKKALTGSQDGTLRLWDLASGKEIKKLTGHKSWTWQVGFSSDEKQAISSGGTDQTVRLWDLEKGEELKQYTGFPKRVYAAAISPDDKYVLGGEGGTDEGNNDIHVFEKESGKLVHKLKGHTGYVWRAVFSPDSKKIASAGMNDSTFRIWDVETGKATVTGKDAHDNYVVAVAFSPKGDHLFTAGRDGKVKMWDAEGGKLVKTFDGLKEEPEALAVSKDGKRFLTTDGKSVVLFEVDSGKIIHRFEEHTDQVLAVAFLPDGRKALSAGKDNTLRLWTVPK
jgi:WD40 repeat protein